MNQQSLRTIVAILAVASMLGLGACGQKGSLYLPDDDNSEQRR